MDTRAAIQYYCSYQERSHSEARNKLYELGCSTSEVEEYIAELIEKGTLNEERFAKAYARGKFILKQWGKQKIIQQLKLKKISAYCIKKALSEIDETAYKKTAKKLSDKKWDELRKERSPVSRKSNLYKYMVQKGYETGMVNNIINELIRKDKSK